MRFDNEEHCLVFHGYRGEIPVQIDQVIYVYMNEQQDRTNYYKKVRGEGPLVNTEENHFKYTLSHEYWTMSNEALNRTGCTPYENRMVEFDVHKTECPHIYGYFDLYETMSVTLHFSDNAVLYKWDDDDDELILNLVDSSVCEKQPTEKPTEPPSKSFDQTSILIITVGIVVVVAIVVMGTLVTIAIVVQGKSNKLPKVTPV